MLRHAVLALLLGVLAALLIRSTLPARTSSPGPVGAPPYSAAQAARWSGSDRLTARAIGLTLDELETIHRMRATSNAALLQMTPHAIQRDLFRASVPKPTAAPGGILWRNLSLVDERGELAPGALMKARAQCEALPGPGGSASGVSGSGVAGFGGIDAGTWEEMGPGNIGGRIRAIVLHPTVAGRMWIGSVSGGIWRSNDGGASWSPVDDFMANLAVTSLVIDPNSTNTMYASTGEGFLGTGFSTTANALQLGRGAGIFKSTDGGVTWSQLAATTGSGFFWVNRLSIAADSSAVLAATLSGIYRSPDGGTTWNNVSGVACGDVDFDPSDPSRAVAGALSTQSFLWSDDGGVTWNTTAIPAGPTPDARRVETTWATGVAGSVYASVYSNTANGSGSQSVLYRSTDSGETFGVQNQTVNFLASQGWYDNIVWAAPTDTAGNPDDQTVIVGGVRLFRSPDGGATFTQISNGSNPSPHADNHFIIEQPGFDGSAPATSRAYFGTDGGLYRADDVFDAGTNPGRADATPNLPAGWTNLNNNLRITQFYGGDAVADNNGTMIGGTQDNGTLLGTGAGGINGWTQVAGADGSYGSIDRLNTMNMFGATQFIGVFRSTNGGATSAGITAGLTEAGSGNGANFIGPNYLDPNDPNRMLAGGPRLWLSTNALAAVPAWTTIKPATGSNISTFTIAPGDSDIIWVGHNNGDVFRTGNGTAGVPTWTRRDDQSPNLPNRFVTRIIVDPANSARVFVCFGGFFDDNVWETTDDGATWRQLTGMPAMPYRDLQIHPDNPTWLYAASELGVLTSENNGFSWAMANDGPANVPVDDLVWVDRTLYAATHGRGWFRHDTVDPADGIAPSITCTLLRTLLWPASKGLLPLGFSASATDNLDPSPQLTVNVYSDEPDGPPPYAPDAIGTTPATTRLRAERLYPGGDGRVYLVVVTAVDDASNVTHECKSVVVPIMPVGASILGVRAQAATAEAYCVANDGQPPPGYTLLLNFVMP